MDKELGNRIKQLRQQADLTQSQLARVLNVSPALISAYELGDRKPSLEILVSLAATFKVSTDFCWESGIPRPAAWKGYPRKRYRLWRSFSTDCAENPYKPDYL